MKIFVTGGAGFIGSHIVEHFSGNAEIVVLDNLRTGNKNKIQGLDAEFIEGDITEEEAKSEVEKIILSQKVGSSGYGFVYDFNEAPEKIILAVHPAVKGVDVAKYNFVQEAFKLKYGIVEYEWKNPNEELARDKIMAVSYFEPWNWQIAFGSYTKEFMDLLDMKTLREKLLTIILVNPLKKQRIKYSKILLTNQ